MGQTHRVPRQDSIELAVARQAERQHGLITLEQLQSLGVGRSAIRTRLSRGQWISAGPSVVRIAGVPVTWAAQLMATVLAAGPDAVASHRAAAALWGLDGYDGAAPEVSVPRALSQARQRDVVVHRSTDLHLVTPVLRQGILTTPMARTLLDLGAVASTNRVHLAIESARARGLVDWSDLLDTLLSHARRGRDGVGTLRAILHAHSQDLVEVDRGLERLVVVLLRNAALPPPVLDHEVTVDGQTHHVGLAFPDHQVALALNGGSDAGPHPLPPGWRQLSFSWQDYLERTTEMVQAVRHALATPEPEGR